MNVITILPNVFMLGNSFCSQYLIVEDDKLCLIDTGMPGNMSELLPAIQKIGFSGENIQHILITHADADHAGALAEIKKAFPHISACASQVEADAIQQGISSRPMKPEKMIQKIVARLTRNLFRIPPARLDLLLTPGTVLPYLGGLEVLDTCGHTPGHLSFYAPKFGVLFCGDSILSSGKVIKPSAGMNTWDTEKAESSFLCQVELRPRFILGGHMNACTDQGVG